VTCVVHPRDIDWDVDGGAFEMTETVRDRVEIFARAFKGLLCCVADFSGILTTVAAFAGFLDRALG